MDFNSKQRRKSIKVWLSDEERILVESKAEFYGYKRLAKYIRDAAIYEKVTYVNLKNMVITIFISRIIMWKRSAVMALR